MGRNDAAGAWSLSRLFFLFHRSNHDSEGLGVFLGAMRAHSPANVILREVDCHINDTAFCDLALAIFDQWVADGVVAQGKGR